MTLDGYAVQSVTPWETASRGRAVACAARRSCAASSRLRGADGVYTIAVLFFDENDGRSEFRLFVSEREVDRWRADGDFPSAEPNGHTAARRLVRNVRIRAGAAIRVEGAPDRGERAVLDYIEIVRQ